MEIPKPSHDTLVMTIANLLARGPLYKEYKYDGSNAHRKHTFRSAPGAPPPAVGSEESTYCELPSIQMECDKPRCQGRRVWGPLEAKVFLAARYREAVYVCRNCSENIVHYFFMWFDGGQNSSFVKVGQYPPLAIHPPSKVAKALGDDVDLYRKALINANYNHGIAALAYLRRIIEHKINYLVDLVTELARNTDDNGSELAAIEEIKNSHHVDKKIELAAQLLPKHLRPGGHDPLNRLYSLASAGLHGEADEECLEIFQEGRFIFEHLVTNLTSENESVTEYRRRLSTPRQVRSLREGQ